jgi:hypothetical protein
MNKFGYGTNFRNPRQDREDKSITNFLERTAKGRSELGPREVK